MMGMPKRMSLTLRRQYDTRIMDKTYLRSFLGSITAFLIVFWAAEAAEAGGRAILTEPDQEEL